MKKLIVGIQEKSIIEKISLGMESICYALAVTTLAQTVINIINEEKELVGIGGTCSVVFIIIGFVVRLLSKEVKKVLNKNYSLKNKNRYSFKSIIPVTRIQKQYKLKDNQF